MMAITLSFGTQTICDNDGSTTFDNYRLLQIGPRPALNIKDIVFANTAGMEAYIVGNQNTRTTSMIRVYGGDSSVIYKASAALMRTFLSNIDTFRLSSANLTGSLIDVDNGETLTGMIWIDWNPGPITLVNHRGTDKYMIHFQSTFIRYTV